MKPISAILKTAPARALTAKPRATQAEHPAPTLPPCSYRSGYDMPSSGTMSGESAQAADGSCVCVITCHNYGRFLAQCVESVLRQTRPFNHIIVVDDASADQTPEIAARFAARGVRYLRTEFKDFTEARRAGLAQLPRSRFVMFVDADNWLAPDFHEKLRRPMHDPRVAVAYSSIVIMDEEGKRNLETRFTPFDYTALRYENYADACALIRAEAYVQLGGWQKNDGLTDWVLWLKLTRAGWLMEGVREARLYYRRHGGNMSMVRWFSGRDLARKMDVFQQGMKVTIVTLFSGRDFMLARYAAMLRELAWNKAGLHLLAIDNSCRADFAARLRETLASTGLQHAIITVDAPANDELPAQYADDAAERSRRPYLLSEHLARLYTLARQNLPADTDLVWSVEDDIDVPPDALINLCAGLYVKKCGVISGCVRSRFSTRQLLAWQGDWASFEHDEAARPLYDPPVPGAYEKLMASGFMCTLFRRDVWDRVAFRPSPMWGHRYPYYDWAAAHDIFRMGVDWLLAGAVRCRHWQSSGAVIDV